MTTETPAPSTDPKSTPYSFDRHAPEYRYEFTDTMLKLQAEAPIAWTESYGGHWITSTQQATFDIARRPDLVSSNHDVTGAKPTYTGTSIPTPKMAPGMRGGFLEMDPPEQREFRNLLNPYLSPAAVARWVPIAEEITRASIDEKIESGRIDFVDDLANIVPAVLTMAMLGVPLADWDIYCEPAHATVYTPPDAPDYDRVREGGQRMGMRMFQSMAEIRQNPRPGMIDALVHSTINGATPSDMELMGVTMLLIGGGFDTTTALTAHALEWLSENPAERERLSRERETLLNPATEELLRFYTPAPGAGRTIKVDTEVDGVRFAEGERLWLSWAMANRDPAVFENPNDVVLDRKGNRHASFGLGIHRCIGSNVARMVFKTMVTAVLDRMPDFVCDPSGAVHYETIGIINGMKHLPATFTPGPRLGAPLDETIAQLQKVCDEQQLAAPITRGAAHAE